MTSATSAAPVLESVTQKLLDDIVSENDVLRDEGEAYGRKLLQAGVPVASMRAGGTIHDFALINQLAETATVRAAMALGVSALRASFRN